ncbi:MAG: glycosyltransferase family 2 protein, partial [Candidatus Dojkabacteria bacterium]
MYAIYQPFKIFLTISVFFLFIGLILLGRFFFLYITENESGLVQSVVIGGISIVIAIQMFTLGIIAELLAVNRRLIEDVLERLKDIQ